MHKMVLMATACLTLALVSGAEEAAKAAVGFPNRQNHRQEMLKKFDKDGDGKLNREERAAMRKERQERFRMRFDADGDGKLNADEEAALKADRDKRSARAKKAMLERFDKNGDGILDETEKAERQKQFRERREARMKMRRGRKANPAPEAAAEPVKKVDEVKK